MSDEVPVASYNQNIARVVREWEVRSHVGKLLTIIESLGLRETQEKAVKDLIKTAVFADFWNNGGTPMCYSKEADDLLQKAIEKEYEMQSKPQETRKFK